MHRLRYPLIATLVAVAAVAAGGLFGPPIVAEIEAAPRHEAITLLAARPIPDVPEKRLVSILVDYPPGARSVPHRIAGSAFVYVYVLSGEVRSRIDDEPARVYRQGEWWFESPGPHRRATDNASGARPARLLAVFVVDAAQTELITPDPR
jgi:quercetin dioxygenase-like cupin family protein